MGVRPAVMLCWISSGCKTVTFEPNSESLEGPEVAHSENWRIWWLWDGLNLGLHKKLLHCEGRVTRHIVIVQIQLFLHFFFSGMLPTNPNGMIILFATCYIITHPVDVMTVWNVAKFLLFLNIAGLPLQTSFSSDSWLFLNWAYHLYKEEFKSFISIIWSNTGVSSSL
jgi:hypothetical protein